VQVTHLSYPRKYKVKDVSYKTATELRFNHDGTPTTVADYFRLIHKKQLRYPHLPCLHMDGKNPHVYIPLEFCLVIKQNCNRKLNQDQMAIMARNTALSADDRERKISEKVREAKFDKDEYLRDFGIKVNTSMKELTGRVLDPPRLEYKGHQFAWPDRGEWKARKKHFYNGTKIGDSWGIIYIQQIAPDQIDIRWLKLS
jgi:eukaryotic translation initiation factor 2C